MVEGIAKKLEGIPKGKIEEKGGETPSTRD
jgi:hypothetical protein